MQLVLLIGSFLCRALTNQSDDARGGKTPTDTEWHLPFELRLIFPLTLYQLTGSIKKANTDIRQNAKCQPTPDPDRTNLKYKLDQNQTNQCFVITKRDYVKNIILNLSKEPPSAAVG